MFPSILELLSRMGAPVPVPIPCVWPNIAKAESTVVRGLWRSTEPVGLRRRLGLLLEGGEPMAHSGGRLITALGLSAPVTEPGWEEDEFERKDKRSKRDAAGSVPVPGSPSSFCPKLMASYEGPLSGSEMVRKSGRWAVPFSLV